VLSPPCSRQRPFFMAGPRHLVCRRVLAPQRSAFKKSPGAFPFFSQPRRFPWGSFEYIVNWLGYEHLALKDTATALEIMKLNATAYPASANAQDSLGDAYLAAGDKAAALTTAKRTLELLDSDRKVTPQQKTVLRSAADAKIAKLSPR
jgi:hypothetical protein